MFPRFPFINAPFQAVQNVLLGVGGCRVRDGLACCDGEDDFVVERVLGIRRVRWGSQGSCWAGVVHYVYRHS